MQADGGRDKTPIMHSLKTIDQIINITCLPMSAGFVTVVLKNPSHYKHPYSPAPMLVSVASVRQTPRDQGIVLRVQWVTCFLTTTGTHRMHSPCG